MAIGILSFNEGGCATVLLVVWHEVSSTRACRQLGVPRS